MARTLPLLVVWLALAASPPAAAFSVGTGFTGWCHEELTVSAYDVDFPNFPRARIPVPEGGVWRDLADALDARFALRPEDDGYRFVFLSLVVGVRDPDTGGHSITNLAALREAHLSSDTQYPHALRGAEDDGPYGDQRALRGAIAFIEAELAAAEAALARPLRDQVEERTVYLEFYGRVPVEVWAPAFHVGVALHTLQDSFSHTVRSADLRRVRHVMNYVDAVRGHLDVARDGLAHSHAMDECGDAGRPLAEAAGLASTDFLVAVREELAFGGDGFVAAVIDDWLSYEAGCDVAGGSCDTPWLALARREPTGPYLEEAFGCAAGGATSPGGLAPLALALAVGAWLRWRAARSRPGRGADASGGGAVRGSPVT